MTETSINYKCDLCGQRYAKNVGQKISGQNICKDCDFGQRDRVQRYQIRGVCEALTLTRKDLGRITGKSPAQLREYWSDEFIEIDEPEFKQLIEQFVLVYALASKICGSENDTKAWFRAPNEGFNDRTPAGMIVSGELDKILSTLLAPDDNSAP
ncbi:MAG: hypothetical protein KGS72_02255 [Cyanobacteria bacterium REEB67]|nr:hypothetical protein [Cyanobacteria bacterium REEB67]